MEENIQNDKLDDYVRKSFDDYSEDPSAGMWERIEGNLPPVAPEAPVAPRWSFRMIRWQLTAAAAIALLLTGLVCEHYYYTGKIRALTVEKDNPAQQPVEQNKVVDNGNPPGVAPDLEKVQQEQNTRSNTTENNPKNPVVGFDDRPEKNSKTPNGADPAVAAEPTINRQKNKGKPELRNAGRDVLNSSPDARAKPPVATPVLVDAPAPESTKAGVTAAVAKTETNPASGSPDDALQLQNAAAAASAGTELPAGRSSLALLPGRFAALENFQTVAGNLPAQQIIKTAKPASGWYAGIQAAPQYTFSSKPEAPPRGKPGNPPGKPVFVPEAEKAAQNTDVWLKIGKKAGSNFALESGVGYRALTRTASHKASFAFKEGQRHPGGPGGGHPSWSVNYNLNTYGGAASVELRADQVDAGTVQDDEKLDFCIHTDQTLELLRVPVLGVAKIGHGRAVGVLKAGLVGNFVLKNELTVTGAESQNIRFSPGPPAGKPKPPFEKRKNFIPGYWASAGLEYRLTRRISLTAEPFISGDFAQNTGARNRLPSYYSAGVNAGVQYMF